MMRGHSSTLGFHNSEEQEGPWEWLDGLCTICGMFNFFFIRRFTTSFFSLFKEVRA